MLDLDRIAEVVQDYEKEYNITKEVFKVSNNIDVRSFDILFSSDYVVSRESAGLEIIPEFGN